MRWMSAIKRRTSLAALIVASVAVGEAAGTAPQAHAKPAPEVEYMYNVAVRRHYNFPNNDAIGYGYGICGKVGAGESYAWARKIVHSRLRQQAAARVSRAAAVT